MDLAAFEAKVRDCLDAARETLGRIEMEVREHGDDSALMEASRVYAQFCLLAREFVFSASQRRPAPKRFARALAGPLEQLGPLAGVVGERGLRPSVEEIVALRGDAEALPPQA